MASIVVQSADGLIRSYANVYLPRGAYYTDPDTGFAGVVIVSND